MASSQKQFDTDLKEVKVIADPAVSGDLINIMLEYDGLAAEIPAEAKELPPYHYETEPSGHGEVPLVSTLFNTIKTRKLALLRTLLTAIVSGKPDEAKAILEKDPSLLYKKLEEGQFVTALSGQKFNLKPYQAALSVDDTQMAGMVKSYFAKLQDAKEADIQFDKQCPKGWEAAEEKKWSPIFNQHDKLALAIRDSKAGDIISSGDPDYLITVKNGSPVEKELLEFWRLLDTTMNEVVTEGKRSFNPNLLSKALRLYDDDKHYNYKDYFGGCWNDPRALLFLQKVIGYEGIQRIMPVNYVQAFQDGLSSTAEKLKNHTPLGRCTRFKIYRSGHWAPVEFYPLRPRGAAVVNFVVCDGVGAPGVVLYVGHAGVSKLMSIKSSRLTELAPQQRDCRSKSTKSFCVIT